jgi:Circadian oscillating protein COP23
MKLLTSNAKLIGLAVACSSMVILPTVLAPAPSYAAPKTTFECRMKVNGDVKEPVTVARRGDRVTEPMITWKDKSFGKYTPEKRCQIVSQRLTKAVAISGKLSNLDMTSGVINSLPVICYITKKGEKCNSENILFSLKASEKGQEQTIVAGLLNFSKLGSGGGIVRGTPGQPAAAPVTYGDAIENALKEPINPNATNEQPN